VITTVTTRPDTATGGASLGAAQGTSLTIGSTGIFNVPAKIVVNQMTLDVQIGGTAPSYTAKVCIYNEAGTTKIIDVTSGVINTAGRSQPSIAVPGVTLQPGNYRVFGGLATQSGTTPTFSFITWTSTALPSLNGASIPAGKARYEGTIAGRTSGVCDANLFTGTLTNINNATPIIRLDN
jgi:hypothetical protein